MPRLNTSRTSRSNARSSEGIPHSPFQKLIDSKRKAKGHTIRSLAEAIKAPHSSLYIWLTNANGHPAPKSFKTAHLKALSDVLNIPLKDIQVALDQSRRKYTAIESPMPPTQVDALRALIDILENDRRKYLLRATILNVARRLYAGAEVR